MRNILIPLAVAPIPKDAKIPLNVVRMTYVKKLAKYNLLPLFISPAMTREMIEELYNMSQGVLLTGGLDINPKQYGQTSHPKNDFFDGGQDELEIALTQRAIQDRKPFLGICRGCQMLNVALGGTLHQHLPDLFPAEEHGVGEGGTYDHLLTQQKHPVIIDSRSHFFKIVRQNSVMVNTGHHQAIDRAGEDVRVVGRSPAGVSEIIEHTDPNYFCFGIQSHPEAEEPSFFESVFETFAEVIVESSHHQRVASR